MKVIKEPKNIEILVNIKYELTDEYLKQRFEFFSTNKKNLNYLFDARLPFKNKIDKLISDNQLNSFIKRIDMKDEVDMYYEIQEIPQSQIKKIHAYVPPYYGCKYCKKAQEEGLFFYCPEKSKHYLKTSGGIKRCPVFRSRDEIIT